MGLAGKAPEGALMASAHSGIILSAPESVTDSKHRAYLEAHAERSEELVAEMRAAVREIDQDRHLSKEGKADRKEQLRGKYQKRVAELAVGAVDHVAESIRKEEAALYNVENRLRVSDPDSQRTLHAEDAWRQRFEALASGSQEQVAELRELLLDLARADNRVALRAIELDPTREAFPILPEEISAEVRAAHVATLYPERAAALASHSSALSALDWNAKQLRDKAVELFGFEGGPSKASILGSSSS